MDVTLDQQLVTEHCPACELNFTVVRGSVFDEGRPFALYLIGLHGHAPTGRLAHLALGILENGSDPVAVAMDVIALPERIGYQVQDWATSPWKGEAYLGSMLDREAFLAHPIKDLALHVAEHVVHDLPAVASYLNENE